MQLVQKLITTALSNLSIALKFFMDGILYLSNLILSLTPLHTAIVTVVTNFPLASSSTSRAIKPWTYPCLVLMIIINPFMHTIWMVCCSYNYFKLNFVLFPKFWQIQCIYMWYGSPKKMVFRWFWLWESFENCQREQQGCRRLINLYYLHSRHHHKHESNKFR